ncbi:MAG: enoyl-CoA hydratase/isomerase family protein [Thermoanaerobaculia bacterium]|nr:enoyl-CoA hydratase/isomerase family protein [Thermoanaerobaculia bacterium]
MSQAFSLRVDSDGIATLTFDLPRSPVNLMSRSVLVDLWTLIQDDLAHREDISSLVLLSGKSTGFIAGANLDEILGVDDPRLAAEISRLGQGVARAWEQLPYPTISAIDGACMGGGTELSLACDHILVSDRPGLKIGLPEVRIGIIPGWGGCVRLPRRLELVDALDLILRGGSVDGPRAVELGLADALLPHSQFRRAVGAYVANLVFRPSPSRKRRPHGFASRTRIGRRIVFDRARETALEATRGRYPAPLRAIEVVRLGIERGAEAGFEAEERAIGELATSPVCKDLIRVFRLVEAAKKAGPPDDDGAPLPRSIAVLGAGNIGAAIAHLIARRTEIPIRLVDLDRGALERAMASSSRAFSAQVHRGRLTSVEAKRRQALIRPTFDPTSISGCDLLIENVYEQLPLKKSVLAEAARHMGEQAILATNTSSLEVGRIAGSSERAERVVGIHFFAPVQHMPLVEVVRAPKTSDRALGIALRLARELGKVPIVVRDSPGFLVNRILFFYLVEALWLLHEGHSVTEIDRTIEQWGMPIGPFAVMDEIGVDGTVRVARSLAETFGPRLPLPPWVDDWVETGAVGRRVGRGFYLYDEDRHRTVADPDLQSTLDIRLYPETAHSREPLDRLMLRMVDEAAQCLDEEIVEGPGQLDLAMILGTGFPTFRGGLCRWADRQGTQEILETLERVTAGCGERFRPSKALRAMAQRGFYR